VHAFVGAGGKTAAIRRLLAERPGALATTTTHLSPSGFGRGLLVAAAEEDDLSRLERAAARVRPLALALGGGGRKLRSPSLDWHALFAVRHERELVLVESDGARRRLVKLPAANEPAWPPALLASVVVVVGAGALGWPLEAFAHRPATFGVDTTSRVGLPELERMVRAYADVAPPNAPLVFLLTGIGPDRLDVASHLAAVALDDVRGRDPRMQHRNVPVRVVVAPDLGTSPFWVWRAPKQRAARGPELPGVCGILLAAGRGERFKKPGAGSKLLAPWRGRALAERSAATWGNAGFAALVVVVGHAAAEVEPRVRAGLEGARGRAVLVRNRRPERGLGSSVRAAARAAPPGLGLLFGHADMPALLPATLRRIATLGTTLRRSIVQPTVRGRPVNPVYFPPDLRPALARVGDASGGRPVIEAHRERVVELPVDDRAAEFVDVDRPADLERLRRAARSRRR
jgi:molybdenum cofactor cytidylyltransferase